MSSSKEGLLNKFNVSESSSLAQKESPKNTVEAAKNKRDANQFENQTRLGRFFVDWTIYTVTFISFLFFVATGYYIYELMETPKELEAFLNSAYTEAKNFLHTYQAALAALITFVFGESIRTKKAK